MRKASPLVHIPGFTKTEVDAAEAVPTTFVDLDTAALDTRGGKVTTTYTATVPLWQHYDSARFVFSAVTVGSGTLEGATVELWGQDAQEVPVLLGRSVLTAEGTLPPIEGVQIAGRLQYAIRIAGLTFTATGDISFDVFAQGYFRED